MVEDTPFTDRYSLGKPVRTPLPAAPFHSRTIVLESFYEVVPDAPLTVRIQRDPGLPGDTFTRPTGLALVKVTPVKALKEAHVVQDVSGYNSWPMTQAIGDKLVGTYSRGTKHTIGEDARALYARTSTDGGNGSREHSGLRRGHCRQGTGFHRGHAALGAQNREGVEPMQITDVFAVPEVGLCPADSIITLRIRNAPRF